MSVKNPVKTAHARQIGCKGVFKMTLGLTAEPDITDCPAEIVLVLDVSVSMTKDSALQHMQQGAQELIDIITVSTGGIPGKTIGGESCAGIVSFASRAYVSAAPAQNAEVMKDAVSRLYAGGMTNHSAAIKTASGLFEPQSEKRKIMVLFTDGVTTEGPDPQAAADEAKAAGVEIYCIGLNAPVQQLEKWASEPAENYVLETVDTEKLEQMFREIGHRVVAAGLQDAVIRETLTQDFRILEIDAPSAGTVRRTSERTLQWEISSLGKESPQDARLSFTVQHTGSRKGKLPVNESVHYSDARGQMLEFPDPYISVECGEAVIPEPCPAAVDFSMDGCQDTAVIDLHGTEPGALGRMVQLDVTVRNICPEKRVAAAVQLTEVDSHGTEHPRGLKCFTIPAHHAADCRDVHIDCIRFILPEDLDVSGGSRTSLCNKRRFCARVMANYIDTDFVCCPQEK